MPHPPSPQVRELSFRGRDDEPVTVLGRLLAFGTSEREEHSDHPGDFAARAERCSACRWFEVSIAEVEAEIYGTETEPPSGRYLVVTAGRTIVPGEVNFRRAEFTDSPYEVVELLKVESARDRAQRETRGVPDSEARRSLPSVSARALAQAAAYDPDLRDAYALTR